MIGARYPALAALIPLPPIIRSLLDSLGGTRVFLPPLPRPPPFPLHSQSGDPLSFKESARSRHVRETPFDRSGYLGV
eukprot:642699-Prorocentrum_minimum.AAC.2